MKNTNYIFIGLSFFMLILSCSKDQPQDPVIPNEEEVITTLELTLTPTDSGNPVIFSFKDLDGDGGDAPTISGGTLRTNSTYTGYLQLLNELENPVGNISEEVEEEAEEHQFFFQSTISGMDINYDDTDANGNPIGLAINVSTNTADSGTLRIILKHEPDKFATDVSSGDITNAGGETDIEVTFPINVE